MEIMNLLCASLVQTVEYRDGGVIDTTLFYEKLKNGQLNFSCRRENEFKYGTTAFCIRGR